MKSSELRIGNWVYKEVGITALEPIKLDLLDIIKHSYTDCFQPIPLTKEWLVKFGFDEVDDYWDNGNLKIYSDWTNDKGVYFYMDYNRLPTMTSRASIDICYIHQLQNLYFALTGEELTP